jgi:hypothetical protein
MHARPPIPDLLKFLAPYDAPLVAIALAARKLVLKSAPKASEIIFDGPYAVSLGYSFTGRLKEAFCHIVLYFNHVNLGFNHGVDLPDPAQLLTGTGKQTRHVTLQKVAGVKDPNLARLLRHAIEEGHILALSSRVPLIAPKTIVVVASAKKRRPPQ